jgi:hypothetical protein
LLGACALLMAPTAASAQPVGATAAATVPASFQPAAESFITPSWGVVLGGAGCQPGHVCRARLVVTADGGAHWRFLAAPDVSPGLQGQVDVRQLPGRLAVRERAGPVCDA